MDETTRSSPEADPLDKVVRIGQLMDLYGGLLTERQRTFVQLHFEEDLSFGEVGRMYQVSRQAVHDAVKHAERSLEDYETKLGLLRRGVVRGAETESGRGPAGRAADEAVGQATPPPAPEVTAAARTAVERLRVMQDRLHRSGGIIYNAEGLVRELGEVATNLAEALPPE
ncbi:MAG: YlxM family DNA-binding protein [Candidatus Sumerlaeia bacterium]|nr:YlxM family DNA-binding protein [Candidatus Sumerlaeia bacterium]